MNDTDSTRDLIDRLTQTNVGAFSKTAYLDIPFAVFLDPSSASAVQKNWPLFSPVQIELISQGAAAIPDLVAHLRDSRPSLCVNETGEYVYAEETCDENPNNEVEPIGVSPAMRRRPTGRQLAVKHPDPYIASVGDLCFVILGQIVNRHYFATDLLPGGITAITSPTLSPQVADQLDRRWGSFDIAEHRAFLIRDFETPDSGWRKAGAAQRLSYYHPDMPMHLHEV